MISQKNQNFDIFSIHGMYIVHDRHLCICIFFLNVVKSFVFVVDKELDEANLRSGLLLLLLPKSNEGDTGDLDDLETDTGDITLSLTLTTETSKENFVVFVDVVQATVIGDESSDLLTVLDKLDTDTLSDGGVGLLGFDTNLFQHNTLGVGRTAKGRRLEGSAQKSLLVRLISPSAIKQLMS